MKRAATLVLALVAGLLTAVGPTAPAVADTVTPDVANLPAGGLPTLPYVNWPARRIVDGNLKVSISGIKARVISLHKVDGGYLLGRELPAPDPNLAGSDLVFVSTKGARRVLVEGWRYTPYDFLGPSLAVSHDGNKVLVNTEKFVDGRPAYVDTRVFSLPAGKVLRKRDFGEHAPSLGAFGVNRALMTFSSESDADPWPDVKWWNPATNALTLLRADASVEQADLSAWQWAVRPYDGVNSYGVQGLPPVTSPDWPIHQEDESIGPWSPDDSKVVGINEVTDDFREGTSYTVFNTSDGTVPLAIHGNFPPQITWESNSALLLLTRVADTWPGQYQLIRCTLAGVCTKVGPSTTDLDGAIIPASRRNS